MSNNENRAWERAHEERAHEERVSAGNGHNAACERGVACGSDVACAAENDSVLDASRFITCAAQLSYLSLIHI